MNKNIAFILPLIMLVSCGGNSSKTAITQTSGRVDCVSIRVMNGSASVILDGTYQISSTLVYEYKSESGKSLCVGDYGYVGTALYVHPDRYTKEYETYKQDSLLGLMLLERNYYYDLGSRTIDVEFKWSEYKFESNSSSEFSMDHKNAYEKAKNGFYSSIGPAPLSSDVYLDSTDLSLDRHIYYSVGDDCIIEYQQKWF